VTTTKKRRPTPTPSRRRAAKRRRSLAGEASVEPAPPATARRHASRQQLSTVAAEWRTTVDTAREVIVMIAPDGRILRANVAAQDLFGRPFSELVGARADEVARPLLGAADPLRLLRTRRKGRPFRGEVRAGDARWFSLLVDPIPASEGGWNGAVCRLRDVTERRRAAQRLRRSLRQVRDLAAHLQNAREEERRLISRQIQDQLGHELAALKLDLAWLAGELPTERVDLEERVRAMSAQLDRGLKLLRRITTELRPDLLDHFGPAAAIEWQAEELRLQSGVRTRLDLHAEDLDLSTTLSTALFRIVQETLSNVARHADAEEVTISLRRQASHVVLSIADDGRGFDPERIAGPSFGLLAMRERALALGGDLSIESRPVKGTTVVARLPIG
jgi:PAS domain S-box-containing protein